MSPPWNEEGVIILQLVVEIDDRRGQADLTGCFAVRVSRESYIHYKTHVAFLCKNAFK
jgi:hypothetical protein